MYKYVIQICVEVWMAIFRKHWQKIFFWHPFIDASHWMQRREKAGAAACIRLTGPMAGNGKYKCFSTWNSVDCHCRKMSTELGYIAMVVWCWRSQIPTIFIAGHSSKKKPHNKPTFNENVLLISWQLNSLCWKWHLDSAILETEAGVCQLPVTALGQAEFLLIQYFAPNCNSPGGHWRCTLCLCVSRVRQPRDHTVCVCRCNVSGIIDLVSRVWAHRSCWTCSCSAHWVATAHWQLIRLQGQS